MSVGETGFLRVSTPRLRAEHARFPRTRTKASVIPARLPRNRAAFEGWVVGATPGSALGASARPEGAEARDRSRSPRRPGARGLTPPLPLPWSGAPGLSGPRAPGPRQLPTGPGVPAPGRAPVADRKFPTLLWKRRSPLLTFSDELVFRPRNLFCLTSY